MREEQVEFYKRLEELGETEVRYRLAHASFSGRHRQWAFSWVAEIDQRLAAEAESRSEASNAEHLRIARSERTAAWIAAISAIAAIIISIIALYLSWLGLKRP